MDVIRRHLEVQSAITGLPAFADWAETLTPQPTEAEEEARRQLALQVATAKDSLDLIARLSMLAALDQFRVNMGRLIFDNGSGMLVGDDEASANLMPDSDLPPRAQFVLWNCGILDGRLIEVDEAVSEGAKVGIREEVIFQKRSPNGDGPLNIHRTVINTFGEVRDVEHVWKLREPAVAPLRVTFLVPSDLTPIPLVGVKAVSTDIEDPNPRSKSAIPIDKVRRRIVVPLLRVKGPLGLRINHWRYERQPGFKGQSITRRTKVSVGGRELS